MIIAAVIFWLGLFLLLYSYVLYPLLLELLYKSESDNSGKSEHKEWPKIVVIIAAFNEGKRLPECLDALLASQYPLTKLNVHVGSDGSFDNTNELLEQYAAESFNIHPHYFTRGGKLRTILQIMDLLPKPEDEIWVFMDADMKPEPDCITELVRAIEPSNIGIASAWIRSSDVNSEGIARLEYQYMLNENRIKYLEGQLWGVTMGVFGACFAIRPALFPREIKNRVTEDFYITMKVMQSGYKSVLSKRAMCKEETSSAIRSEVKRRVRIAYGNYQNLIISAPLLKPLIHPKTFAFISHKVLRWIGPFLLIGIFISGLFLAFDSILYSFLFFFQLLIYSLALLDYWLIRFSRTSPIRFITYFVAMNASMFIGFIHFIQGKKMYLWEPTIRK